MRAFIRIYKKLPHFFGYKWDIFSFQNNSKNLDLSYKTDVDLWDCLGKENFVLYQISQD